MVQPSNLLSRPFTSNPDSRQGGMQKGLMYQQCTAIRVGIKRAEVRKVQTFFTQVEVQILTCVWVKVQAMKSIQRKSKIKFKQAATYKVETFTKGQTKLMIVLQHVTFSAISSKAYVTLAHIDVFFQWYNIRGSCLTCKPKNCLLC